MKKKADESKRLGSGLKFFMLIFIPIFILTGILFYAIFRFQSKSQMSNLISAEKTKLELEKQYFERSIYEILMDIEIISITPEINEYFANEEGARELLEKYFYDIARVRKVYQQIRILDTKGMEIVRIDYRNQPVIIDKNKLQNKADRYYFKELEALKKDQLYLSPIDLNVEKGEIEKPYVAMLRVGLPLFNEDGEKKGYLILNYYANSLIEGHGLKHTYLLNGEGHILWGGNPEDRWGFMFDHNKTFNSLFPGTWNRINSSKAGHFIRPDGLYIFNTINLDDYFNRISMPEKVRIKKSPKMWKMVSWVSSPREMAGIDRLKSNLIFLFSLVILPVLALSFWVSTLLAKRIQTLEKLQESEERYELALKGISAGVWDLFDVQNEMGWWSPKFYELLGYEYQEIDDSIHNFWDLLHPDDYERTRTVINNHIEKGEPFIQEYRLKTKSGQYRWFLVTAESQRNDKNEVVRLVGSIVDVHDRKEAETRFKAIFDSTFSFIGLLKTDGSVIEANKAALDFGGFRLEDIRNKKFWEAPWWQLSKDTVKQLKDSIKKAVNGEFVRYEVRVQGKDQQITIDFSIMPVFDENGEVILLVPEGRNIEEKKRFEDALRTSENQLKSFVRFTPAAVAMFDNNLRYMVVSERWYKDYNLKEEDILGKTHYEVFPEILKNPEWLELHRRALEGEILKKDEDSFLRADGNVEWLRWEIHPWEDNNDEIGGIIMFTEVITEQKKIRDEIYTQAQMINQVKESIVVTDPDGIIELWNRGAEELFGYKAEEKIGKHISACYPEDQQNHLKENVIKPLKEKDKHSVEVIMQRKNGEHFDAILSLSLRRNTKGEITGMIGSAIDITERKEREMRLKVLEEAVSVSPIAFLISDVSKDDHPVIFANIAFEKITGYSVNDVLNKNCRFLQGEDKQQKALSELRYAVEHNQKFEGILRNYKKNGELFWNKLILSPITDEKNEVKYYLGIIQDITEQVKFNERIQNINVELEKRVKGRTADLEKANASITLSEQKSEMISQAATSANAADTIEQALTDALEIISRYTDWHVARAFIPDTSPLARKIDKNIWFRVDKPEHMDIMDFIYSNSEEAYHCLTSKILHSGKPHMEVDLKSNPDMCSRIEEDDLKVSTAFGFPVFSGGQVAAVLEFFSASPRANLIDLMDAVMQISLQLEVVIDRKLARDELEKLLAQMEQRMKELNCLYEISYSIREMDSLDKIMEKALDSMRVSWQFPEITNIRISIGDNTYTTNLFRESPWKLSATIYIHGLEIGSIEVFYSEEKPEAFQGPFLKEEKNLLEAVARLMSQMMTHRSDEKSLQESEERYRILFESSPDGIMAVDVEDKKIRYANSTICSQTGYSLEEIIGMSILQLHPTEDIQATLKSFNELANEEKDVVFDIPVLKKNGEKRFFDISGSLLKIKGNKYLLGQFRDITDNKEAQEKIKKMSLAVEQSPVSVLITNTSGEIEYVNPKFTETTGFTKEEAIGKTPSILKSGMQPQEFYNDLWETISSGLEWQGEFHNKRKDGTLFWEAASIAPLRDDNNNITHFVAVKEDITERKKFINVLQQAKEEAESANKAKSLFLANMSHELRTPLNAIIGFSQILQKTYFGPLNEKQTEYVRDILDSGKHLLALINDILDVSKVESGKMELDLTMTDLSEILESSLIMIREKAAKHGIDLSIEINESAKGLEINIDQRKIKQVLFNLLSNAAKFTPDGGAITLSADFKDNVLHICVKDTGTGIAREDQEKIFDKFFQTEQSRKLSTPGTGLGLPLSRHFVEMHGGRLGVYSEGPDKGSTFSFTIPLPPKSKEAIKVGILHSLTGTMSVSEKPLIDAELLAIKEINEGGGLLGRKVEPVIADGCSDPLAFSREAQRLIEKENTEVIFGCWTSACRKQVKKVVEKKNSLLVYPVQYEGLESSPNILYLGAAANQQIIPSLGWIFNNLGNRLFLVGSDYIFPHSANRIIRDLAEQRGSEIVAEDYVGMDWCTIDRIVEKIKDKKPDVIINTLNGHCNKVFFQTLRKAGITSADIPTFSFSIAEEELFTYGSKLMKGDYAAWSYFQNIDTPENRAFVNRFREEYGSHRVISDPILTAYNGVKLWARAVETAKTPEVEKIMQKTGEISLKTPEGLLKIDPGNNNAYRSLYIGKVNEQGEFDVIWQSKKSIRPVPFPMMRKKEEWEYFLRNLYHKWGNNWTNRTESKE